MHARILVLISVGLVLVLGLVLGLVQVCRVLFLLVLCMDGSARDGIRVGSNSVIQSFSEYHDNSCARLNALQNVRSGCLLGKKTFFFSAAVKKRA